MTENNHWKDAIAAVDKDKTTYESQVKDYNHQADTHQSRRAELKARCPEKVNSASVAAACNAEWAPVNQEGHNLTAWRDRLNQAKADLQTRYTNINNMIKNFNERITTLSMDQMNAVRRYNRANKRVDEIHKELSNTDQIFLTARAVPCFLQTRACDLNMRSPTPFGIEDTPEVLSIADEVIE